MNQDEPMHRRFSTWLPHAIGLLPIVFFTVILCAWSRPRVIPPESPMVVVQDLADSAEAVDHDYAVLTTDSGEFELNDVPVGKQILSFCHERARVEKRTVFVSSDQMTDLGDIELNVPSFVLSRAADRK